jgi:S-adenosylhomocysteine hydrolase
MNAVVQTLPFSDFKVRDMSLADWGRKDIDIA